MLIFVIGGAGSGKSEIAENICTKINKGKMAYIATMFPYDKECIKKIEKHKQIRKNKNFVTLERYNNIADIENTFNTVLVECISNLTANIMYIDKNENNCKEIIIKDINKLIDKAENVVIVSNDVFCDGIEYDSSTIKYINNIGSINKAISSISDIVIEAVCGISVIRKGKKIYEKYI